MKIQKVLSLFVATCLVCCLSSTAYAVDEESRSADAGVFQFSEYDLYMQLQQMSADELMLVGYSQDEIELIEHTTYEELILERAMLTVEQLSGLGYTDEQIVILKSYGEGITPYGDIDLYALSGVCTGSISCNTATEDMFEITYNWSWDHCPFVTFTDAMAVRWCAFGSDGNFLDVDVKYESGFLTYYFGDTPYSYESVDPEDDLGFRTLRCPFDVSQSVIVLGQPLQIWAQNGGIDFALKKDKTVTRGIHYVKVAGLYGHSVISIGAPTLSASMSGDIALSFSGGLNTDNIAGAKVKISLGGKITNISG